MMMLWRSKMKLKIDEELDNLFSDIKASSEWTYEKLKDDIKKYGIKNSLIVSQEGIIVCGHQRFKIATELKLPKDKIPYEMKKFKSRSKM